MFVMAGTWTDVIGSGWGVSISFNGGQDWEHHDWQQDYQPRYTYFVSKTEGWVSGGSFPTYKRAGTRSLSQHIELADDGYRIVGAPQPHERLPGWVGVIAHSTDGGKEWTVQFNDTGSFYFNGIFAADPLNVWAVAEGYHGGYVYHTADGGATWEQQLFVEGASMTCVKFLDKNEGWVAGAAAVASAGSNTAGFWHTLDGGATWDLITLENHYVMSLDILDATHVYATAFSRAHSALLHYVPA
eukprot:TRINITY_DN4623_c0_g1_i1.p1 TRINITY_DN4623_c0_g1~~TRINITY_DN4623_c0_g1_i1.p1  ORF type:complete len:243 (-),score=45.49 TRINITY_DN4623_c0_g1_i1:11-739(-)